MNNLNIYKVSGLAGKCGSTAAQRDAITRFESWTAGTQSQYNTRAYNYLLSLANLKIVEVENLDATDTDYINALNELDLYVVALYALDLSGNDVSTLMRLGAVIDNMIQNGQFVCDSLDDAEREKHLNNLFVVLKQMFDSAEQYTFRDGDFARFWQKKVVDDNFNAFSVEDQERLTAYLQPGKVGAMGDSNRDLPDQIMDSGTYFLYLFLPEQDVKKYNKTIQVRRKKELEMYQWLCETVPNYTPEMVMTKCRSGVIAYYKKQPEKVIEQLNNTYSGGKVGVLTEAAILAIISAVVAVLTALIVCIQNVLVAKYSAPSDRESGVPQDNDWGPEIKGRNTDGTEEAGTQNKFLLIGGVALLGYVLYSNSND